MHNKVKKNKFGFYELANKPTYKELKEYYTQKYYQTCKGSYKATYTKDELKYIEYNIALKIHALKKFRKIKKNTHILDIGCGEGWLLKYLSKYSNNLIGLDFSDYAIKKNNTQVLKYLIVGDILENLKVLANSEKKFDIIWMDNVLEHLLYPEELMKTLQNLVKNGSFLVIEVPNDFSPLQIFALKNKIIKSKFWIITPDHISYFNPKGLINFCNNFGWKKRLLFSDFPIDLNILNPCANYVNNPKKGKCAHQQRVSSFNFIFENNKINDVLNFYVSLFNVKLGRQIIGIFEYEMP
ncbi:MAG: class I SAM-dependent methyltransferase [Bacteroidales bacterium]|nr:class I SAM-dependent methyltransferase [Bacteroidales bacterium]